jgi:hypothetical protein
MQWHSNATSLTKSAVTTPPLRNHPHSEVCYRAPHVNELREC